MKNKVSTLEVTISKFNKPQKDLSNVLDNMQFGREGIGYNANKRESKPKILQSQLYATKKNVSQNKSARILRIPNDFEKGSTSKGNTYRNNSYNNYRKHEHVNLTNTLRKATNYYTPRYMYNPNVICHYCCKIGHISPVCYARHRHLAQNAQHNTLVTNTKGPKKIWVPKSTN